MLDLEKIEKIEKIKKIVLEKGFCILEIKNIRNVEFFIELKKVIEKKSHTSQIKTIFYFIYGAIILGIVLFLLKFFNFSEIFIFNLGIFIFITLIFFCLFFVIFFKEIYIYDIFKYDKNLENLKGLKNKYVIIFENNVFIDKKNFSINSGDLRSNYEVLIFLFDSDFIPNKILEKIENEENILSSIIQNLKEENHDKKYLIEKYLNKNKKFIFFVNLFNKQEKIFSKFYENTFLLENETKNLVEIKNILEKNISENKDFFAKSLQIQEGFEKFSKKTGEILKKKDEILDFLKKFFPDEKISFEKYIFWLKKQIISPLNSMKDILQKNLDYCNFLLEKNKNNENEQIQLSNKRLEIQKNNLQKQIYILDEKIKILEK